MAAESQMTSRTEIVGELNSDAVDETTNYWKWRVIWYVNLKYFDWFF